MSPKLLNMNPEDLVFFYLNPYKIEVMITSLIEMLRVTKPWSHLQYNLSDVMDKNYDVITFNLKNFSLKIKE